MKKLLIPTETAMHLAENIKHYHDSSFNYIYLGLNRDGKSNFPDGEIYVSIPEIKKIDNKDVVIICSGIPNPNDDLETLRSTLYSIRNPYVVTGRKEYELLNVKPNSLSVFFSYFPYSRQDFPDTTGGINKAEALLKELFNFYHVDNVFTIDAHFSNNGWTKKYPKWKNISAMPLIIKKIKDDGFDDFVETGPDIGSNQRYKVNSVSKHRLNSREVKIENYESLKEIVDGKIVVVKDDILSTGRTMKSAGKKYKELGAKKLIAANVHLVLSEGFQYIIGTYDHIYTTNTINSPYGQKRKVDVSPLIAKTIKENI